MHKYPMRDDLQEDLINVETAGTLDGLFHERLRRSPDRPAYRYFDAAAHDWRDCSWREVAARLARWQSAIAAEGFDAGERAAVQLRNGVDWICFDQAVLGAGLVSVPLYTDDRPDNIAYVLDDAAVRLLLVQNLAQWNRLAPALRDNVALRKVLVMDEPDSPERKAEALGADARLAFVADWLPAAAAPLQRRGGDPRALASIVYTSGTTGRPKGVMLSHYNMLSVAHAALASMACYPQDLFLSFLPLSHTLERTGGYYLPMMAGASVAYARSVAQLAEDLGAVRPTILIAVPRIFERVHGRIVDQLARRPAPARALFHTAVRIGWRHWRWREGQARWSPELLLNTLLKKRIGDKVTAKLGGRLRYAICGGAALPFRVAQTFIGLGLEVLHGYGLTETSPVISVNRPGNNDPASVGEPLRGIEVRIGENSELLVKTPGAMLGYWNDHAATSAVIDPDGWLHTGDQARLAAGRIYLTGRIKDILVMSNGEKVSPTDLEAAICADRLIDQALVVGEGKSFLAAVLVLDPDRWFGVAGALGLDPLAAGSLRDPRVEKKMLSRVKAQLHDFPRYATVRRLILTLHPWTVEDGCLTPTLKVKRSVVLARFLGDIERLYGER
jgi:long-chain acyl-CoA synthetase